MSTGANTCRPSCPASGTAAGAQQFRIRPGRCGFWQDRMMHIDQALAPDKLHRRQLEHPIAVVALVVFGVMVGGPAVRHQRRFHLAEPLFRHQDIDIREQPARRRRQARHCIGGALQPPSGLQLKDFSATLMKARAGAIGTKAGVAPTCDLGKMISRAGHLGRAPHAADRCAQQCLSPYRQRCG